MIRHPCVQAQSVKILLITPPPVNEHQMGQFDYAGSQARLQRRAENTRLYADACKDVGAKLQVTVVDLWTACLREVGWKEGDSVLPGSLSAPRNERLDALFLDGKHIHVGKILG